MKSSTVTPYFSYNFIGYLISLQCQLLSHQKNNMQTYIWPFFPRQQNRKSTHQKTQNRRLQTPYRSVIHAGLLYKYLRQRQTIFRNKAKPIIRRPTLFTFTTRNLACESESTKPRKLRIIADFKRPNSLIRCSDRRRRAIERRVRFWEPGDELRACKGFHVCVS